MHLRQATSRRTQWKKRSFGQPTKDHAATQEKKATNSENNQQQGPALF
jgi:hypothetical protein